MKKRNKIVLTVLGAVTLSSAISLIGVHANSYLRPEKISNIYAAYAVNENYQMELNASNAPSISYSPFGQEFLVKNYNNDNISFIVKRGSSYNDGFMRLSGGNSANNEADCGFIYNDFVEDSANFNGLDGISSIKIIYSSVSGKLRIKTGRDLTYGLTQEVTSNVEISFNENDAPSHFRIENVSGAGANNDG